MEFWGVEVKAGEPLKVTPDDNAIIHLSQAALGESKKGNEPVMLFVKVGEKRLVLGTLSSDNFPQLSFDVVFEQEFELSHNWKHGSVHFCGYQTAMQDDDECYPCVATDDMYGSSEDEEEDFPLKNADNGKLDAKAENAKPAAATGAKSKVPPAEPTKVNKFQDKSDEDDDSEGDSEDEDDSDESAGEDSEEGMDVEDDDEDASGESGSEDEETPMKVELGQKRSGDSATKTPVPSKKAKAVTPQKTDGKNVHTDTPHPAKNAGKTAANGNKQTPKSGGQFSCKSCDRSFNSDNALQSHTKAKHGK